MMNKYHNEIDPWVDYDDGLPWEMSFFALVLHVVQLRFNGFFPAVQPGKVVRVFAVLS